MLANVSGIFPGASASAGVLTLPSGSITSFTPSNGTSPGGVEMIYGLLETMSAKVIQDSAAPTTTRVTATASSRLSDGLLRRTYLFTVDLAFTDADLADLNVASEPA